MVHVGRYHERFVALCGCLCVAAAAAIALDGYQVAKQREEWQWAGSGHTSIPDPISNIWIPKPLPPGTTAPQFTLVDARTGSRTSLAEHRGRPVVLLLSSFG